MKIFILEDHPMVLNFYCQSLYENLSGKIEDIVKAVDCETAYHAVTNKNNAHFDIVILDFRVPPYVAQGLHSGIDVAKLIRKFQPRSKIVLITSTSEILPVYDMFKKVNPEGIALKSEVDTDNFISILTCVQNGDLYQSTKVKEIINEVWRTDIVADESNRQILFYMVKGHKIKDLEKVVNLSTSSIQRRIADIKKAFQITDDSSLIKKIIDQGFL